MSDSDRIPYTRLPVPQFTIGDRVMYRHPPMNGDRRAILGGMRVEAMLTDGFEWVYRVLWWSVDTAQRFEFPERDLVRFPMEDAPLFGGEKG